VAEASKLVAAPAVAASEASPGPSPRSFGERDRLDGPRGTPARQGEARGVGEVRRAAGSHGNNHGKPRKPREAVAEASMLVAAPAVAASEASPGPSPRSFGERDRLDGPGGTPARQGEARGVGKVHRERLA